MNSNGRAERFRSCNLCNEREREPLYEISGYHIVKCLRCGLCYVAEKVADEELVAYYGENYYQGGQEQGYADYLGHRDSRKSYFRTLLPTLRRHLTKGETRVLDVGCAAGFFLEVAREAGWRATGIELSPFMSDYARRSLGLDVLTGTLETADLPESTFDLITMWDVIEHLTDPRGALNRASRLVKPGGVIVVSTGDITGVTARIYGRRWALLAPPGHLFYFSRQTLFTMLRRAGFEPLDWQSDGTFLINDGAVGTNERTIWSMIQALHHRRAVHALLRRLKLGSIITVYARRTAG